MSAAENKAQSQFLSTEKETIGKWTTLYALRERIIAFVSQLERRTRLYPPPFHRHMVGGETLYGSGLNVRWSEAVSTLCRSQLMLGVFNDGATSNSRLCNYYGWLLSRDEYFELNDEEHENMGVMYGVDVPLKAFVDKNWNAEWNPAWKEAQWVVLGDPVSTGANVNTASGLEGVLNNSELHIDTSASMKLLTADGRYALLSECVSVHKKNKASIAAGAELFIAYDNVIREKVKMIAERAAALEGSCD